MRKEKLVQLLKLATTMAGNAEGMTIDEMANAAGVSRRTAERMRDAIEAAFQPLEHVQDGRQTRFRMSAKGIGSYTVAPTSLELAELENAAREVDQERDGARAEVLRGLASKIRATLRDGERRRVHVDVDAQIRSEGLARSVGPRPLRDSEVLSQLRHALIAGRQIELSYKSASGVARRQTVIGYGLIFGARYYLVAIQSNKPDPAMYRLDRMTDVRILDTAGAPPSDFDIDAFAQRSFGVFQETPQDIIWRFDADVADDARQFVFHPNQETTTETDDSLTVRFQAGGLREMALHLMTWGAKVTIVAPVELKVLMDEMLQELVSQHGTVRRV
jgi:predicted DNA-binding transcriptional regulator YafY